MSSQSDRVRHLVAPLVPVNKVLRRTCAEPVKAADHHGLSAGAAARHGELFLVGTTATAGRRVIVELSGRTSGLVVELHREVTSGRNDMTGSPTQRVRRHRMHDDATLHGNGIIVRFSPPVVNKTVTGFDAFTPSVTVKRVVATR